MRCFWRMMAVLALCGLWGEGSPAADVAVVKCTLAVKKDPALAKGFEGHREAVTKKLQQYGVPFDLLTDEQVVAGKLAGYRLVIFPYNTVSQADEIQQILAFVERGGKLVWFYAFPKQLGPVLGIEKCDYRSKAYAGEFFAMQFGEDRPAGFPPVVRQQSPNCRIVEKLASDGRVLAFWHDQAGKDTKIPAVVLSPRSLYVAHVLWSDADAAQQSQLLLAAIGHFLPDKWDEVVTGVLGKAADDAGYKDLGQLVQAAQQRPAVKSWADKAAAQSRQARESLAAKRYGEAVTLAKEAYGSAQSAAAALFASRPCELRGAWIHPNDSTDWEAVMSQLQAANFNAVFPLMCGPGSASFPSAFAPQSTQRDHMRECCDAARRHGIEVHVWKANWQVLSSSAQGPRQQFLAEGRFVRSLEQVLGKEEKSHYQWSTRWLDPSQEKNRQLEYDMMLELVERYHPAGIHFDFMRYPEINYCYCDHCRQEFQRWAGVQVEQWPQDCAGKGALVGKFRDWRRDLQTSLVRRIAEGARKLDPQVKLSLAARSSMTGSFESDAQDWVTWAKEGYLDFLCPMDYTDRVDVLRSKLQPQVAAIEGAVPIYAGLGVSPTRSATAVNLSQQIQLARELGADGFLVFAWSPFSGAMLPAVKLGATSTPVTHMPHHAQALKAVFQYPASAQDAPPRTYLASQAGTVSVQVLARAQGVKQFAVRVVSAPAAGGEVVTVAEGQSAGQGVTLTARLPVRPGIYLLVVEGKARLADGTSQACYLRSLPLTIQGK